MKGVGGGVDEGSGWRDCECVQYLLSEVIYSRFCIPLIRLSMVGCFLSSTVTIVLARNFS